MTYYAKYIQRLIGGNTAVVRSKIEPGQIISFRYKGETTRRKLNRMVLVLGKHNKGSGLLLHGINIEHVPESKLYAFLKRVIIKDTLSLIKRKYELKGPFSQLIDRPKSFYENYVKNNLLEFDCYRTYKMYEIRQPKLFMLDWKKLRIFDNTTHEAALITRTETLSEVKQSRMILNKILKQDISNLNNARFKKLINDRFGSLSAFYEMLSDIKSFVDQPGIESEDDFDATKT